MKYRVIKGKHIILEKRGYSIWVFVLSNAGEIIFSHRTLNITYALKRYNELCLEIRA